MELTVKQYADKRKVSKQSILQRIKDKKPLPGVTSVDLKPAPGAGFYMLTIDEKFFTENS